MESFAFPDKINSLSIEIPQKCSKLCFFSLESFEMQLTMHMYSHENASSTLEPRFSGHRFSGKLPLYLRHFLKGDSINQNKAKKSAKRFAKKLLSAGKSSFQPVCWFQQETQAKASESSRKPFCSPFCLILINAIPFEKMSR